MMSLPGSFDGIDLCDGKARTDVRVCPVGGHKSDLERAAESASHDVPPLRSVDELDEGNLGPNRGQSLKGYALS